MKDRVAILLAAVCALTVVGVASADFASAQTITAACDPATPPAINFLRIPRRVVWGREYVFGFRGDDSRVDGNIHVVMASPAGAKPFFSGDVSDVLGDRLFVELDRGDAPGRVTASYNETQADGSACVRVLAGTVVGTSSRSALPRTFFASHCTDSRYRPRSVVIACGDGNLYVTRIRWRGWNGLTAKGSGTAHLNDCIPDCARGHFHTHAIRLRAYKPRYCGDSDRLQYSDLDYVFTGTQRPPLSNGRRIRFPCGGV